MSIVKKHKKLLVGKNCDNHTQITGTFIYQILLYTILVIAMETEQFNIRMPKDLVQDLDIISKLLKVNKSEWVKTKLAEEVHEEKNKLLIELSTLYANGMINKEKIEKMVGKDIADEMEFIKKKSIESAKKGIEIGRLLRKK